jgi:polysaccharide export outer membrane protein
MNMMKHFARSLILIIGMMVCGCAPDLGPVAAYDGVVPTSASPPVLERGDKVKVAIYGEENLSGVYEIDSSGSVSLPLAGSITAAGRTNLELQRAIEKKYKGKYLQDPKVTVEVSSFRPIYVLGEAVRPGEYPYRSGLNLISAVTAAGGFTYRASHTTVLIQHAGEGLWREYPLSTSVAISPGDLIRIPERYF